MVKRAIKKDDADMKESVKITPKVNLIIYATGFTYFFLEMLVLTYLI
jgi:hypothetical protein